MADVKLAYAASGTFTITLASLSSSSTFTLGRESTAIVNTSNLYEDYLIGGRITVGTTPTANTFIEVWAYAGRNDTPSYPDVITGTDGQRTFNARAMVLSSLHLLSRISVPSATSDLAYPFGPVSLLDSLGQFGHRLMSVPKHVGIFVTHNTGVVLNATGGNHVINHIGVYRTVV